MLPDAAIHIFGDANLEAVAKQPEHVQVLLLRSQTVELLLKCIGTSSLDCLGTSSLLPLLGDGVVLSLELRLRAFSPSLVCAAVISSD